MACHPYPTAPDIISLFTFCPQEVQIFDEYIFSNGSVENATNAIAPWAELS
jgi:hypothetical protein